MVGAGVVYGRRGEVFEERKGSLNDFIRSTFEIEDVFKTKLVMGRCICHGKKTLETDLLLDDQESAMKFLSSQRCNSKPHILLIYDKHDDSSWETNQKQNKDQIKEEVKENNVTISKNQWNELVSSIKKVELLLEKQQEEGEEKTKGQENKPFHANIFCDGCSSPQDADAKEICGVRYKCLTCPNFDLCSECEDSGFENGYHKGNHNMIKIKMPAYLDIGSHSRNWGRIRQQCKAKSKSDKEVVIDIPEEEKELFEMFGDIDKLKEIAKGYKSYKKWVEDHGGEEKVSDILRNSLNAHTNDSASSNSFNRPKTVKRRYHTASTVKHSPVKVEITRKDTTVFFKLFNRSKNNIPGGFSLVYSVSDSEVPELSQNAEHTFSEICNLTMGPHELLVDHTKTLRFNFYPRVAETLNFEKGDIKIVDPNNRTVYSSTKCELSGKSHTFFLEKLHDISDFSNSLQTYVDTTSSPETCQLLEKEQYSDGVISSNVTNDDETIHSGSSQDSNWDEYDFLSESDV